MLSELYIDIHFCFELVIYLVSVGKARKRLRPTFLWCWWIFLMLLTNRVLPPFTCSPHSVKLLNHVRLRRYDHICFVLFCFSFFFVFCLFFLFFFFLLNFPFYFSLVELSLLSAPLVSIIPTFASVWVTCFLAIITHCCPLFLLCVCTSHGES